MVLKTKWCGLAIVSLLLCSLLGCAGIFVIKISYPYRPDGMNTQIGLYYLAASIVALFAASVIFTMLQAGRDR